ncbi:leucine-rich repeat domain-containing protein [Streptomyces turgidiscabies]|uniref:leucine-rich repeat domain-containing protein n=1 Tax=Streptomyces turgidiscabies TaxID=85558 RepID=UPI0027D9210E|nr:leucine-rich repeat domain-containing protein [Streptomyces turgidiscabies]
MPHVLNLWRRQLGQVPESVWRRTELQVLILADNGLTDLPPEIGRLHRLATLDLGHNHLTSVPAELGDLADLSGCLYLHDNKLSEIPDSLGNLTRLRYLNVSENTLTVLPEAIGRMAGLIELRAQHNRLTTVEDYAAVRTSQTPAACRCSTQMAVGSGLFRPSPGASLEGPGWIRCPVALTAGSALALPPSNVRPCQERAKGPGCPGVTARPGGWSSEPRCHVLPPAHRPPPRPTQPGTDHPGR